MPLSLPSTISSKKRLAVGDILPPLGDNGVHVHDHFVAVPLRVIDDPEVIGCIRKLSRNEAFDDGSDVSGIGHGLDGKQGEAKAGE
jgi:hypothetical protein